MGLLDSLKGSGKKTEIASLRAELNSLKKHIKAAESDEKLTKQKHLELIDKTHAFMERLKVLVGTFDGESVLIRCWDLLDLAMGIKKGAIYKRSEEGWVPEHHIGFAKKDPPPVVPHDEDSMVGYVAEQGLIMSLAFLRKQDDLAYMERRGIIPDAKIVCPVRVGKTIEKLIIICSYSGNVFSGEDDLDTVQMVATILGLVLQNSRIISKQSDEIENQRHELLRLRTLFTSMVAPEVIDFIEKNPGGIVLGGVRQKVAILFVDIRSFTELASIISPERTIELLNNFFTVVTEIVIKSRGTLDKFMGDAAMALYGTPVPLENPTFSAVQTAIQIQKQLEIKMPEWVAMGFPEYQVGIGINFQEVVVGNVGSERLSNFTAIGDGVNIASRLCSVAGAGEILVSESCFEELTDLRTGMEKRTGIKIKGKEEPITVYALSDSLSRPALCPECSSALPPEVKFCGSCGYKQF